MKLRVAARAAIACAAIACAAIACGSTGAKPTVAAPRPAAESPTGNLLARVPRGAQGVVEIDVARLRGNDAIGRIVDAIGPAEIAVLGYDALRDVDRVVIASYDLGAPRAEALVLVRGAGLDAVAIAASSPGTEALDEHTLLQGGDRMRDAARRVAAKDSVLADDDLMSLRERAVPTGAPGSSLLVYARFDPGARVALAATLGIDEVPSRISIWGDVVDDAALVAWFQAEHPAGAARILAAIRGAEPRLARLAIAAGVPFPRGTLTPTRAGASARVTWVVGPRALSSWVDDVVAALGARRE